MSQMIFLNLPVKDLETSKAFWNKLGYSFNPQFTDENAACLVISDTIFAMLLTEQRFKDFTKKEITDATTSTEAIFALSAENREAVDTLVDGALAAGGFPSGETQDFGFMYGRAFQDVDHHNWEVMWMDVEAMQEATAGE
ncbi:VOC family protein [Streptomyces genisteinicus]|uniref:VOC family protein n=1 Tax=Streptomyces genisteinicus TaxID=2768068 RepID=A0A7H0HRN9_9ACTN|nr:VOC family protein [Streptomyces genisteinicus]QNP63205.1 VOC family protein [Streptomyces genisteinicus]